MPPLAYTHRMRPLRAGRSGHEVAIVGRPCSGARRVRWRDGRELILDTRLLARSSHR